MAAAGLVPLYVILTIARSHDVTYLNGIFEMKNAATPIFITQPYMYIANNYDNFDCLVRELPAHSMGLKGMFPLWALSGLKFIKPALVDWPIYVNKEELTTVTSSMTRIMILELPVYFCFHQYWERLPHGFLQGHTREEIRRGTYSILRERSILCSRFLQPGIPILRPGFTLW